MRRLHRSLIAALCALLTSACGGLGVRAPVVPPTGFLFTNVRAPLTHDFHETPLSPKHGTAVVTYVQDPILTGLNFAWGDADIASAAQKGGIDRVQYADYELLSVLGIYVRFTVHAYGD